MQYCSFDIPKIVIYRTSVLWHISYDKSTGSRRLSGPQVSSHNMPSHACATPTFIQKFFIFTVYIYAIYI